MSRREIRVDLKSLECQGSRTSAAVLRGKVTVKTQDIEALRQACIGRRKVRGASDGLLERLNRFPQGVGRSLVPIAQPEQIRFVRLRINCSDVRQTDLFVRRDRDTNLAGNRLGKFRLQCKDVP